MVYSFFLCFLWNEMKYEINGLILISLLNIYIDIENADIIKYISKEKHHEFK